MLIGQSLSSLPGNENNRIKILRRQLNQVRWKVATNNRNLNCGMFIRNRLCSTAMITMEALTESHHIQLLIGSRYCLSWSLSWQQQPNLNHIKSN